MWGFRGSLFKISMNLKLSLREAPAILEALGKEGGIGDP